MNAPNYFLKDYKEKRQHLEDLLSFLNKFNFLSEGVIDIFGNDFEIDAWSIDEDPGSEFAPFYNGMNELYNLTKIYEYKDHEEGEPAGAFIIDLDECTHIYSALYVGQGSEITYKFKRNVEPDCPEFWKKISHYKINDIILLVTQHIGDLSNKIYRIENDKSVVVKEYAQTFNEYLEDKHQKEIDIRNNNFQFFEKCIETFIKQRSINPIGYDIEKYQNHGDILHFNFKDDNFKMFDKIRIAFDQTGKFGDMIVFIEALHKASFNEQALLVEAVFKMDIDSPLNAYEYYVKKLSEQVAENERISKLPFPS